ncbi:TPA: RNA ligase family protein [Clostridioides difficile]
MKEIKKYTDIIRYGKNGTQEVIKEGDIISITEKLDGANSSFTYDEENYIKISCYSRKTQLSDENKLRGFYDWIVNNIVPIKNELNKNYRYIGEWLVPHKVKYKEKYYKRFYLFSIWDELEEKYLSDEIVIKEAKRLGLETVEYFYLGKFISYEHFLGFIGKSNKTEIPNNGEGIVIKNWNYLDRYGKQVFVKLVSSQFAEIQKQKLPKNPNISNQNDELIKSVLTKPRVEKIIYKLIDEGLLNKNEIIIENMGMLLKLLGGEVLEDILKEESEILLSIEDNILKKRMGKILPTVVKDIIKSWF